jgi:aldehyde:ferredoxin oxidoreductase
MHDLALTAASRSKRDRALPTRNFQDGQFEGADKITGTAMRDTILIDREGCYAPHSLQTRGQSR